MGSFVSFLYRLARLLNDLTTLASGNPKRITRRAKNKWLGRKSDAGCGDGRSDPLAVG